MTDAYSQPPSRTRPPRILIVEDDLVIALMIEEFVREFGYAVSSVAGTVAMARQQIAQRNFDAVLLDINMEGEYQPETADILLEAEVPFAFVTGYDYVLEPRHEGVPVETVRCSPRPVGEAGRAGITERQSLTRHKRMSCDPTSPSAYLGARCPTQSPTRWR